MKKKSKRIISLKAKIIEKAYQIDNAIALCPNCHRKAHYSNDRKLFVKKLKEIAVNHI